MPEFLIQKWSSLSFLQKALLIVGLPLILILWISSWGIQILAFLEKNTRSKVDKKSEDIDAEIKNQQIETDITEERVHQLEKEKNDAANDSKEKTTKEAVDFWNSRPSGDNK